MNNKKIQITPGDPKISGVTKSGTGYNFAVDFDTDEQVTLLLYQKGEKTPCLEIPMEPSWYVGKMAAVKVAPLAAGKYQYNYRVGTTVKRDPYARAIVGKGDFGTLEDPMDSHQIRCGIIQDNYGWEGDRQLQQSYSEMILYKIHVRGYTKQSNSQVRHKGTFQGVIEKIPYLLELGITALELMPVYDFEEVLIPENLPLEYAFKQKELLKTNFWGYAPGNYFAPKPAYGKGREIVSQVKDMVKALHKAGISCILEFYFPPAIPGLFVLQVLHYWYLTYHVDGFHLVGQGVPRELICQDSLLGNAKLLFDQVPLHITDRRKVKNKGEYNEGFKQDVRRLLKGDEDSLAAAINRIRKNPQTHAVINYLTNQDGFTMMDLVSYDNKHNEANQEANKDGTTYNYSWNCGIEGQSKKIKIRKLRQQQIRNGFLLLLLAQGVPMIYGGDEFGNSQQGNNNAYCQDNEIGWVDWKAYHKNKELVTFVKELIAFRKEEKVFSQNRELKGMDYLSIGYPDISCHSQRAWYADFDNMTRQVGLMYCGTYAGKEGELIYVAYNLHWEPHEFALPRLVPSGKWVRILESSNDSSFLSQSSQSVEIENQKTALVEPRTIAIFKGQQEKKEDASMETF